MHASSEREGDFITVIVSAPTPAKPVKESEAKVGVDCQRMKLLDNVFVKIVAKSHSVEGRRFAAYSSIYLVIHLPMSSLIVLSDTRLVVLPMR